MNKSIINQFDYLCLSFYNLKIQMRDVNNIV